MIKINYVFITSVFISVLLSGCSQSPEQRLFEDTKESVIMPLHQHFAEQTQLLASATQNFCKHPSPQLFMATQLTWKQTMDIWQGVQLISFGPLAKNNFAARIQFWPDKKNLVATQTEELIAASMPITVDTLATASVAVQGLPALEYLLYDQTAGLYEIYSQPDGERRCQLLQAAAANAHQLAQQLYTDWQQQTAKELLPPVTDTTTPNYSHFVNLVVGSLVSGIDTLLKNKFETPMGYRNKTAIPQPYAMEAWRSEYSIPLLVSELKAMRWLFTGAGYGLEDYLKTKEHQDLVETINKQFSQLIDKLSKYSTPLFTAVTDDNERKALAKHYQELSALQDLLKQDLPAALNITLGFNASDGD